MKRYGGVKNSRSIDDIEEAVAYKKPPLRLTKWELARALFMGVLYLLPRVILWMVIIGAISLVVMAMTGA